MKKELIFQEIQALLETTREQMEWIKSSEGRIPRIELDIVLGNVRKLYESLKSLESIDNQPAVNPVVTVHPIVQEVPVPPVIPVVPAEKVVPVVETIQPEEIIASIPVVAELVVENQPLTPVIEAPLPPVVEIQPEPVMEAPAPTKVELQPEPVVNENPKQPEILLVEVNTPVEAPVQEIKVEEVMPLAQQRKAEFTKPASKPVMAATLFDDTPTVGDKFHGEPTVYDKIAGQQPDTSIAHQHQMTPVSDLKKSIGINEKFLFINELFDGDLSSYNRCIDELNLCSSMTQAMALLNQEFAFPLSWDMESKAYLQLRNLVERRYL